MLANDSSYPIQTYKSYKGEKFEKYIQKQKAVISGVNQSSLKQEDKKALLMKMRELIESALNS